MLYPIYELINVILFMKVYRQFRVGLDFDITMSIKPRNITGLLLGIQGRRDYLLLQVIIYMYLDLKITLQNFPIIYTIPLMSDQYIIESFCIYRWLMVL